MGEADNIVRKNQPGSTTGASPDQAASDMIIQSSDTARHTDETDETTSTTLSESLVAEAQTLLGFDNRRLGGQPTQGDTRPAVDPLNPAPRFGGPVQPYYKTAPPGSLPWLQNRPGVFQTTPVPPGPNPSEAARPAPASPQCPSWPLYNQLLDKAARNMFDPSSLLNKPELQTKFNCQIKSDVDAYRYANLALRETADAFAGALTPDEVRTFDRNRQAKRVDLGATFRLQEGKLIVDRIAPGGSSETAGLRTGDIVTHVNGAEIKNLQPAEIQQRLLGGDATTVGIKVLRDGKPMDLSIAKTEREIPTVRDRILPGTNVAYLRLDNMDADKQPDEMKAALERHAGADAFVIDLRGNPGGLFNNALKMSSLFLDQGTLLKVSRRLDSDPSKPEYKTTHYVLNDKGIMLTPSLDPGTKPDSQMARFRRIVDGKPVVILVDGRTASSSEIFAAALKENGVATVIGTQTYGKGDGQSVIQGLPQGGALKVTSFRFYSPKGHWFGNGAGERHGIVPDITSQNPPGAAMGGETDAQLRAAQAYIKLVTGK